MGNNKSKECNNCCRLQHKIVFLNRPQLSLILRWCVAITLVGVVVYTANQKMSVPSPEFMAASESADTNATLQGPIL